MWRVGSIPDVMRAFKAAPEWKEFEDELLALAECEKEYPNILP